MSYISITWMTVYLVLFVGSLVLSIYLTEVETDMFAKKMIVKRKALDELYEQFNKSEITFEEFQKRHRELWSKL